MTKVTETDLVQLKDLILGSEKKIEQSIQVLGQKIETLQKDVTDIKIELADIKGDLKALDAKVDSIDKRTEKVETSQKNQIWALIGILGTVVLATVVRFVFSGLSNNA
jgi:septal ring factor EnvC (AmiA/AmiB activator)